tara:strand:- start:1 stop:228 length:228 start_codon:yes stop_codon:yes gene_type:complete
VEFQIALFKHWLCDRTHFYSMWMGTSNCRCGEVSPISSLVYNNFGLRFGFISSISGTSVACCGTGGGGRYRVASL